MKTFWGWRDQQLPDAKVIRTSPSGQTYVTMPGSALLFPALCTPTAALEHVLARPRCSDQSAGMPKRRHNRAHNRTKYIAAKRRHNRSAREAAGGARIVANDEPPPF
jgi:hypothetical protein